MAKKKVDKPAFTFAPDPLDQQFNLVYEDGFDWGMGTAAEICDQASRQAIERHEDTGYHCAKLILAARDQARTASEKPGHLALPTLLLRIVTVIRDQALWQYMTPAEQEVYRAGLALFFPEPAPVIPTPEAEVMLAAMRKMIDAAGDDLAGMPADEAACYLACDYLGVLAGPSLAATAEVYGPAYALAYLAAQTALAGQNPTAQEGQQNAESGSQVI